VQSRSKPWRRGGAWRWEQCKVSSLPAGGVVASGRRRAEISMENTNGIYTRSRFGYGPLSCSTGWIQAAIHAAIDCLGRTAQIDRTRNATSEQRVGTGSGKAVWRPYAHAERWVVGTDCGVVCWRMFMKINSVLKGARGVRVLGSAVVLACVSCADGGSLQAQQSEGLTREELLQRVVAANESVQVRALEAEISGKTAKSEYGVFEPQLVGAFERDDSQRPNDVQELASLGFQAVPILFERNTIYTAGIDTLTPLGTKFHVGYTLRDLQNNLQHSGHEYETFVGTTITQPLLKNFGTTASMARIRIAALASDVAFQEYRKQLMLVVSQAESSYWDLYLMQEQEKISADSVATANKILGDSHARKEVGKGSDVDVLQAEAGVSLRKARQTEAHYKSLEGVARLTAFFSMSMVATNQTLVAVDTPAMTPVVLDQYKGTQDAFRGNPDYLMRQYQLSQDEVRLKYARNQRLPQVDAKGSYGFNGLGGSLPKSWGEVDSHQNPTWTIGVELTIPLLGGIKERNELAAARLGLSRSALAIRDAEVQIASALASALSKVRTYQENQLNHQSVVDFHQKLLQAQLTQLDVGAIESRYVLETEEKLAEAKTALVEDLVQYRRAVLELELVRGAILESRKMEVDKTALREKTLAMLKAQHVTADQLEAYKRRALKQLEPPRDQN